MDKPKFDEKTLIEPRFDVMTLNEILSDDEPPPPPIIDNGILLENSILQIFGKPKSGKTFLSMALALGMAAGKGFGMFRIPTPRTVLYSCAEGGYYPMRDRIKTMARSLRSENSENLKMCFDSSLDLKCEEHMTVLRNKIAEHKVGVLVIDTLARHHSYEENSATEMSQLFGTLRRLTKEHNLAVVFVHHTGWDKAPHSRGSSVIAAEYDSSIQLIPGSSSTEMRFDMRFLETPEPWEMRFNPQTLLFEPIIDDPVSLLLSSVGKPLTKQVLVELLLKEECFKSESGAYKAIDRARNNELIAEKEGMYTFVG